MIAASRIAGFLEREGILERDEENSYLNLQEVDEDPMRQVLGCSVSYRIAIGPQQGRREFRGQYTYLDLAIMVTANRCQRAIFSNIRNNCSLTPNFQN